MKKLISTVIQNIKSRCTSIGYVVLMLLSLVLVTSLISYFMQPLSYRVFLFESLDSDKLFAEKRFLPKNPEEGYIRQFIDDLVLQPTTPRLKPLFSTGTRVLSSFVRDGILYVDLSEEALMYSDGTAVTEKEIEVFKKNIFTNFNVIDEIHLYIGGKEISIY